MGRLKTRLIDAQDAFNVLTDYYHHSTHVQHLALQEALNKVPTADAIPVSFIQELITQDNQFIEEYGGIQECEVIVDGLIERVTNYEALIEKWRKKNGTETD